jgi:hypothetical protein
MQLAGLILLCLIVSGLLAGWVLQRFGIRGGAWFSFLAGMLATPKNDLRSGDIPEHWPRQVPSRV